MQNFFNTVTVAAVGSAFGFMGGLAAVHQDRPVSNNVFPSNIQVKQPDNIVVPRQGLRFTTEGNQTIMALGVSGNSAVLQIFDSTGSPSITLTSGTKGRINIDALNDARVRLSLNGGGPISTWSTDTTSSGLRFSRAGTEATSLLDSPGEGASLKLGGKGSSKLMEVATMNDGNTLRLFGTGDHPMVDVVGGKQGSVKVQAEPGKGQIEVLGSGQIKGSADGKEFTLPAQREGLGSHSMNK